MMAAISAAEQGARVIILEKNKQLGRKLAITGKGRCNVTNACSIKEVIDNTPGNGQFLYSALHKLPPDELMAFMNRLGVELKIERGNRVFPVSDKASEVVNALRKRLKQLEVETEYDCPVDNLILDDNTVLGVEAGGREFRADAVIIATGGVSYPTTGSSGDGYRFAAAAGHSIISPRPSLVPLELQEKWVGQLAGLTLKNVEARVVYHEKELGKEFGELLFTHFGVSGPIILSLSHSICRLPVQEINKVRLLVNLKPALSREQLAARVQRDLDGFSRKHFVNSLSQLLPQSLIPVIVELSGIPAHKESNQITREERAILVELLTVLPLTVSAIRPIDEAIVTSGGVNVREVDPKTMESKLVKGLFFAGELLDVDAYTGGYNLQIAFCTGYTAGIYAADV